MYIWRESIVLGWYIYRFFISSTIYISLATADVALAALLLHVSSQPDSTDRASSSVVTT